jgi:hypothetical protein
MQRPEKVERALYVLEHSEWLLVIRPPSVARPQLGLNTPISSSSRR